MKNDYSTDPVATSAGSSPPDGPSRRGSGSRRSRLVWFVAALGCALSTARFGVWQLSRAHAKLASEALIAERGVMPALTAGELARDPSTAQTQWQRHITVSGQWDAAHTVMLMNRSMGERPGFYVMTPLRLPDGGAVVVQRGWAAGVDGDPTKAPPVPAPSGTVTLHGHVAPWPSHWIDLGHGAGGVVRQNIELAPLAAETGLALRPAIVVEDANADNADDGLGRDWPPPTAGVSIATHYGYAVQWFAMSLAFLGLYVWLQFVRPRGRARADSDSQLDDRVDDNAPR